MLGGVRCSLCFVTSTSLWSSHVHIPELPFSCSGLNPSAHLSPARGPAQNTSQVPFPSYGVGGGRRGLENSLQGLVRSRSTLPAQGGPWPSLVGLCVPLLGPLPALTGFSDPEALCSSEKWGGGGGVLPEVGPASFQEQQCGPMSGRMLAQSTLLFLFAPSAQVPGWPPAGVPSEGAPPCHLLPPVAMARPAQPPRAAGHGAV